MNKAIEIANSIDCYGLMFKEDALEVAMDEIHKIEESLKFKF